MTVSKSGLESALKTFFTPPPEGTLPQDADPTDHQKACAALWADAMQTYVSGAFPGPSPAIAGTASANLKTALEAAFAAYFALDTYESPPCTMFNAAFDAFGAEIFASPVPLYLTRAWIGLTPPPPIDFCSLGSADDYAAAAANFANLIDTWFTSGVSKTTDDNIPAGKPPLTETWS
jgi:hypothetical protein